VSMEHGERAGKLYEERDSPESGGGGEWREAVGAAAFNDEERWTVVGSGAGGLLHYGEQEAKMRQKPKGKDDGRRAALTRRGTRWQPQGQFQRGAASPDT
jgi:hypothetical protein